MADVPAVNRESALLALKVITSPPASVIAFVPSVVESLTVRVLAFVTVTAPVEEVSVSPFMDVAVAAPKEGVVNAGELTLATLPVPDEERAVTAEVPAPKRMPVKVAAPVPPCATESGVESPVREVMSLFAPEAAKLTTKLARVICLVVPAAPPVVSDMSTTGTKSFDAIDVKTVKAEIFVFAIIVQSQYPIHFHLHTKGNLFHFLTKEQIVIVHHLVAS